MNGRNKFYCKVENIKHMKWELCSEGNCSENFSSDELSPIIELLLNDAFGLKGFKSISKKGSPVFAIIQNEWLLRMWNMFRSI